MQIRPTTQADIAQLQQVLDTTQLFPSEMLPEMFAGSEATEIWLTCVQDDAVQGFCYAVPEQMTDGVWNMLAIAVSPDFQGQGQGGALVAALEDNLRRQGARIVIADTSGGEDFVDTRAFYVAKGYAQEARIRDFWGVGDDKIVFWKALG